MIHLTTVIAAECLEHGHSMDLAKGDFYYNREIIVKNLKIKKRNILIAGILVIEAYKK